VAKGSSGFSFTLAFFVVAILALVPLLFVRFPPINDYPFHLARIVILARLDDPVFSRFYQQGSFLLPNLGMDAVAIPLSRLLGPELATRVFVQLTLIVMLAGTTALHWAAHRRFSPWPLIAVALLHNGIFRFGFFNYLFGLGIALMAAAAWMIMRPGIARLALALLASIILIWCHFESFGVFAVIVGSVELYKAAVRRNEIGSVRALAGLAYSASPFVLSLILFAIISPTAGVVGHGLSYPAGFLTKPVGGLFSLSSGILWLDMVSWGPFAAIACWLVVRKNLSVSRPLAFASGVMLLTFIALPESVMGALNVDVRIGPALALLVIASFDIRVGAPRLARDAVVVVVLLIGIVRSVVLTTTWVGYDRDIIRPIVDAIAKLGPGSTLFAATAQEYPRLIADSPERRAVWEPPLKHVASYAVLSSPVFVPMTWAEPTQQPLLVKPPYQPPYIFQGNNPKRVYDGAAFSQVIGTIHDNVSQGTWPGIGEVYLLVVGASRLEPFQLPPSVARVAKGANFVMLQFKNPAQSAANKD
jgi:hypothetical protein